MSRLPLSSTSPGLLWVLPACFVASTVALGGCASDSDPTDPACVGGTCDYPNDVDDRGETRLCAAIRGNGQLITAHFASLARITEHYGPIDAAAGGSSASITIFMAESINKNPLVTRCGDERCSDTESAARAALLLKSFPGYVAHLGTTDEAAAFMQLQALLAKLQTQEIEDLLETDAEAARTALEALLSSPDIRDLINPEIIATVQLSPNPEFHVADIIEGIKGLGNFSVDSAQILIRPGVINFASLGEKFGRAASFYAGYGPADEDAMEMFFDECAMPGLGMDWFAVAGLPAQDSNCGGLFDDMVGNYRETLIANEDQFPSRIDDKVGQAMPALISTSVLTGEAVNAFKTARATYMGGAVPTLEVNFDDVRFGYWGAAADMAKVAANENGYDDLKTQKLLDLGEATWREVLAYSPAEPGLARALELPDGNVSAGGWSDLHPVLALNNLGCEQVVYVTREGNESGFAIGVAGLLGMSEADQTALYDLDEDSSYSLSIAEAGANYCTNWNAMDALNLPGITADGFNAPMEANSDFFTEGERRYAGARAGIAKRGCTPGAARSQD